MRDYDPRIGRFPSVDPLAKSYPWYSPYQYAGNKPVWKRDIDGLEEEGEEGRNAEADEAERERDRDELSRALRSPTPEERERERKNEEEFLRKPKEERESIARRGLGNFLGQLREYKTGLNNYGKNAFEAMQTTLSPPEAEYVKHFVANKPGPNVAIVREKEEGALSTDALRDLSKKLGGVEVAQIYVKQGSGGYYHIIYGSKGRIEIPSYSMGQTPYLISHIHPSGNPKPSTDDINMLKALQQIQVQHGQPVQSSSQIIPTAAPNVKFNTGSQTHN